jgi:hypothetical protein
MVVSPPSNYPFPAQTFVKLQLQGTSFRLPTPFSFVAYSPSSECYLDCSSSSGFGNCFDGMQLDASNQLVKTKACNCTKIGRGGLGCTPQLAISAFTPRSSPNVGGTMVTITVSGIDRYDIQKHILSHPQSILCRFGELSTPAFARVPAVWMCQTPPLNYNGTLRIKLSLDGGGTWFDNSYQLFYYYTLPSLLEVLPSVGPTTGGTLIVLFTSFNHTFVAPPRQSRSCFQDDFATIAGNRTTFNTFDDPITLRGIASLCPYQVATQQHDAVTCLFSLGGRRSTVPASIIDVDQVQCKTPSWTAQGLVSVSVALDGQSWSSQELIEGQKSDLYFYYYLPPLVRSISPDLGPYSETTAITLRGFNLNPKVNLSRVECQFLASAGLTSSLVQRQARRVWKGMAVFLREDNTIVCICPKFSAVMNDVQETNQVSQYLRSVWICEVKSAKPGHKNFLYAIALTKYYRPVVMIVPFHTYKS